MPLRAKAVLQPSRDHVSTTGLDATDDVKHSLLGKGTLIPVV